MAKICGIYIITNPIGLSYIGQSTHINKRKTGHKCSKTNSLISLSIRIFGWYRHCFKTLEVCKISDLKDRERYWQDYFETVDYGLNILATKGNNKPGSCNRLLIEAMRNANIGSCRKGIHSEQFKERQRQKLKLNHLNPTYNRKTLLQFDMKGNFIKEWESLSLACKTLKINIGNTADCAQGNRNQSAGFKWKYKN